MDEKRGILSNGDKIEIVSFENEKFLKIANCNEMRPLFMSIFRDSNHWIFNSGNGG